MFIGNTALGKGYPDVDLRTPFNADALVDDWESLEHLINFAYSGALRENPAEHPLLVADPSVGVVLLFLYLSS